MEIGRGWRVCRAGGPNYFHFNVGAIHPVPLVVQRGRQAVVVRDRARRGGQRLPDLHLAGDGAHDCRRPRRCVVRRQAQRELARGVDGKVDSERSSKPTKLSIITNTSAAEIPCFAAGMKLERGLDWVRQPRRHVGDDKKQSSPHAIVADGCQYVGYVVARGADRKVAWLGQTANTVNT